MSEKYSSWSHSTDWNTVCRRAAGRRRYNSWRRFQATQRRQQVIHLALQRGRSLFDRGIQAQIARTLGVHRSTVHRDIKAMLAETAGQPCPLCGSRILVDPRRHTAHNEED